MNDWKKPVQGREEEVKDHYYAFVDKGGIDSPGAIKQFEGS